MEDSYFEQLQKRVESLEGEVSAIKRGLIGMRAQLVQALEASARTAKAAEEFATWVRKHFGGHRN
jgi:hypothetical protein